jgi:hypothetical protein
MSNNTARAGGIVAGVGCLFGLAPLIISFAALAVGSDIGNTLHWLTLMTAPIGAVIVVVGLIVAIVGASRSSAEDLAADFTGSTESTTPDVTDATSETSTESIAEDNPVATQAPVTLPPLPASLARSVKVAYAVGFVVVLVSALLRVTLFQPMGGILTFFDLLPAFFAGWFVVMARKAHEGIPFLRLYRSQLFVSIAGCVAGLYPLIYLGDYLSFLNEPEINKFQMGGTIITGLVPLVASVASLVFAAVVRARYRSSALEQGTQP